MFLFSICLFAAIIHMHSPQQQQQQGPCHGPALSLAFTLFLRGLLWTHCHNSRLTRAPGESGVSSASCGRVHCDALDGLWCILTVETTKLCEWQWQQQQQQQRAINMSVLALNVSKIPKNLRTSICISNDAAVQIKCQQSVFGNAVSRHKLQRATAL